MTKSIGKEGDRMRKYLTLLILFTAIPEKVVISLLCVCSAAILFSRTSCVELVSLP